MLVSLKNELDPAIRIMICIKVILNLNIWVHVISTFCEIPIHKVLLLHDEVWLFSRKNICRIVWVPSWMNHFHRTSFLFKRMPEELWLFRFRYLAETFLKMIKVSCPFKENNQQNLLSMLKFKLLKSGFWKIYICFPNFKTSLVRLVVILTCDFFDEMCHHFEDVYNSVYQKISK